MIGVVVRKLSITQHAHVTRIFGVSVYCIFVRIVSLKIDSQFSLMCLFVHKGGLMCKVNFCMHQCLLHVDTCKNIWRPSTIKLGSPVGIGPKIFTSCSCWNYQYKIFFHPQIMGVLFPSNCWAHRARKRC